MRLLKSASLTATAIALGACSPITSSMKSANLASNKAGSITGEQQNLSCLDSRVDYVLGTEVLDFELVGGGGLNAGFSPAGMMLVGIKAGVNYSKGQLQTMMHIQDPMKPGVTVVDVPGSASANNFSFSLNANLTMATFGPSFWYSTPVFKLSNNALSNNLTNVSNQLQKVVLTDWWIHVSDLVGTNGFFIPAGSTAGIQEGDEFKVMDASYEWAGDGSPCRNELIMPVINSDKPKAVAKAVTVGVDYTYLQITKSNSPISAYDYVTISSLVQPAAPKCNNILHIGCPKNPAGRTTLARSIRIGSIASQPFPFVDNSGNAHSVDISPFVRDQLETLLPKQPFGGFYIHP
jgi:hypothetical protein